MHTKNQIDLKPTIGYMKNTLYKKLCDFRIWNISQNVIKLNAMLKSIKCSNNNK